MRCAPGRACSCSSRRSPSPARGASPAGVHERRVLSPDREARRITPCGRCAPCLRPTRCRHDRLTGPAAALRRGRMMAPVAVVVAALAIAGCGGGGVASSIRSSLPSSLPCALAADIRAVAADIRAVAADIRAVAADVRADPHDHDDDHAAADVDDDHDDRNPDRGILGACDEHVERHAVGLDRRDCDPDRRRRRDRGLGDRPAGRIAQELAGRGHPGGGRRRRTARRGAGRTDRRDAGKPPERWTTLAGTADTLAASLRQLEASSPGEEATGVTQAHSPRPPRCARRLPSQAPPRPGCPWTTRRRGRCGSGSSGSRPPRASSRPTPRAAEARRRLTAQGSCGRATARPQGSAAWLKRPELDRARRRRAQRSRPAPRSMPPAASPAARS